ncbi:hypothetical protein V8V91_15690 [Algoriphagus halophilus]|uniref:hypothetical protein n=1 Tax=Algoriphagus halophilus TaxID=226505 RepID=UPI00358EB490
MEELLKTYQTVTTQEVINWVAVGKPEDFPENGGDASSIKANKWLCSTLKEQIPGLPAKIFVHIK